MTYPTSFILLRQEKTLSEGKRKKKFKKKIISILTYDGTVKFLIDVVTSYPLEVSEYR